MERNRTKKSTKIAMVQSRKVELPRYATSLNIPVEEVAPLFRCGKCLTAPIRPPLYNCRSGHLTCAGCFSREHRDCFKCKEPLLGRNEVVEEVVRGLPIQTCTALTDCSAPLRESRSDQSLQISLQDPSHLEQLERARLEAERAERVQRTEGRQKISGISSRAGRRPSHKPVGCPYPCNSQVTLSSMIAHFEFHHPHVVMRTIDLETEIELDLCYEEVVLNESRCHVIFIVLLDKHIDEDRFSSLAMLKMSRSSQDMMNHGCFVSALSVGRITDPVISKDGKDDAWFCTVWATSLYDNSPVSYTVTVANEIATHAVSFTGPLVSLQQSQRPQDVYARGECLLVPPGLLREMPYTLRLAVAFHNAPIYPTIPEHPPSKGFGPFAVI